MSHPPVRRSCLAAVTVLSGLAAGAGVATEAGERADAPMPAEDAVLDVIAFGSCNKERQPQDHWPRIAGHDPDLFLFIGDNVYADIQPDEAGRERMAPPETVDQIAKAWNDLAADEQWQAFRSQIPFLATWDDHDYGNNDDGKDWRFREEAQQLFLDFAGVASDDPLRRQAGIHHARTFGPEGRRVQVIMLDTRYHRDGLDQKAVDDAWGPYRPTEDTSRTLLGAEQWAWLDAQLREPADVRIIASSIQVIAWEHGWETWGNYPHERARLFDLIRDTGAGGVVFVSGDRHLMELSRSRGADGMEVPYPMWDFTSSGLNEAQDRRMNEPNRYRVGPSLREANHGLVRIDWDAPGGAVIRFEGRGVEDEILMAAEVELADLQVP